MCDRHLIHIIIHISKQIHSGWLFAKQFFDPEILVSDLFFDCQLFLVHFCKQINQSHIKINEAFIWIICLICRIICFFSCFIFPYQQIPDSSRFFIIADKVQNIEIFFSLTSAQSPSKLLQKDNRRFCRTQEHYHIDWWNIYTFVEHIHWKDNFDFSIFQFLNRFCSVHGKLSICITINCCRRNSSFTEFFCHFFCMFSGTAES